MVIFEGGVKAGAKISFPKSKELAIQHAVDFDKVQK